ncbi:MarR family transcriptional regulator [Streptomyces sp. LN245]|uniref:MarR family transcriptional regulator n=1 Tax=Streptomyces sp. LN245 TaxID=3112975 RepID=UPI0037168163
MDQQADGWDFLTNHARVLWAIARDPAARIRDIAAACHITERTAQRIIGDLEQAGYLSRERDGQRTRYTLHLDGKLRHPTEAHLPVRVLLEVLTSREDLFRPVSEGQGGTHGDSRN